MSFTASAGLAVVGTATLIWRSAPAERFLTATPLWFAAQQAIEGTLWLRLHGPDPTGAAVQHLTTAYLAFALFWWPGYTCFAAWWLERIPRRRRILGGMTIAGTLIGAGLYAVYLSDPTPARIVNASIAHDLARPGVKLLTGLYVAVSLAVGIVSSHLRLKLFYALFAVSTVIALLWYRQTFTSVWCFFAAALSTLLWFDPRPRRREPAANSLAPSATT